jgi:outer membrane protein assembly factor BamB
MKNSRKLIPRVCVSSLLFTLFANLSNGAGWPIWGGDGSRNMVSSEIGLVVDFNPGDMSDDEVVDMKTTKNVKWIAKLGSQAYGNVTVANGRVFVGTNNESPRDPGKKGDRGVVMCLDEKTGDLLWQLVIPKLGAGKVSDWEYIGVCSSPAIDGDKVYVVTNRCEVVCLDINGLADGNAGPFKDEGKYVKPKGKQDELNEKLDADIIWMYDMRDELGVFPHNVTSSSALVVGDIVYVATSNGVDWSHTNIPSPLSPSWIALDKNTGELIGEDGSGASANALHAAWSSLTYGKVDGKDMLIWGGTDGFCYGYPNKTEKDPDGYELFKPAWKVDCNEPHYRKDKNGKKVPYATPPGPSELIGTPVLYDGKVYCAIGQDPEHGDGVGRLSCIDASNGKVLWKYTDVGRTISTMSVADDLVYLAEYAGIVHCLDAKTGKVHWTYDSFSRIWGSTLVVDGKVLLGNEDGDLLVMDHGKKKPKVQTVGLGAPVYSSPVFVNGTLYLATQTHLYAIGK